MFSVMYCSRCSPQCWHSSTQCLRTCKSNSTAATASHPIIKALQKEKLTKQREAAAHAAVVSSTEGSSSGRVEKLIMVINSTRGVGSWISFSLIPFRHPRSHSSVLHGNTSYSSVYARALPSNMQSQLSNLYHLFNIRIFGPCISS